MFENSFLGYCKVCRALVAVQQTRESNITLSDIFHQHLEQHLGQIGSTEHHLLDGERVWPPQPVQFYCGFVRLVDKVED